MNAAPVVCIVTAPATQALWQCFMGIGLVWLVTLVSVAALVDRLPEPERWVPKDRKEADPMMLTLIVNGQRVSRADASCLTHYAGTARQGEAFTMGDSLRDALLDAARELQGITRPTGHPGEQQPRRRLVLYRDTIHQLESKGLIPDISAKAGREIGAVYEAVTSIAPSLAMSRYGEVIEGEGQIGLPPSLATAYLERFAPWRLWARHQWTDRKRSLSLEDLTLLVCVTGLGQRQAADRLCMDQRRLLRLLQQSLWRYCLLAGWVAEHGEKCA